MEKDGRLEKSVQTSVGKPEGRSLAKHRRKRKNNIKMNLKNRVWRNGFNCLRIRTNDGLL
jgi:hypothetical protein